MTYQLVVEDGVAQEVEAQAAYYLERAGPHIALQFATAVDHVYRKLVEARLVGVNHRFVRWRRPIRRVFLERFPFAIAFYVEDDTIRVTALEALRRRPGYWRSRLR